MIVNPTKKWHELEGEIMATDAIIDELIVMKLVCVEL